ncbi:phage minor capsid protein [Fictibacillus aquaticus]|uniref:Minor capsid protein n=1 Tax=Fictibacillus aquaticus TaxID=2021314 RepID=A0A235FBA0_9BACL|nr:phage minor capsid protein [Fictibacillus aquaticus]OYD58469.1 hypothetical protein CGZ90_00785 [Fictibacillus aquaticus]
MNLDKLLLHFSEVMEDIFGQVNNVNDLLNDKKKMKLIESIFESLDRLGMTVTQVVPNQIKDSYYEGIQEASVALQELVATSAEITATVTAAEMSAVISGVLAAEPSKVQKRIHLEALSEIADDTLLDLQAAIRTAKKNAKITIEKTLNDVRSTMAKNLITGDPRKVAAQEVAQAFAKNGLTSFVTKDGKKLPLDFYARTVVNTKIRDAHVKGSNQRYTEAKVGLVQIHENSTTCPICSKYRNMVVSLTGEHEGFKSQKEVKLPPYHPNCHGTTRPYVEAFKTDEELQQERDKWKKWEPEKDTRTPAQRKAYEKEQEIRRKANQEKKAYANMVMALGDKAPKTLGAYRRMKRQNTIKFQELQDEYRSTLRG